VNTAAKENCASVPPAVLLQTRVWGLAPKNATAVWPESSVSSTLRWGSWQVYDGTASARLVGLDYFGARYFSGAQGRFTGADPALFPHDITDPQSWNKYVYTRNNPLRYVDPDGADWQDVLKGVVNAFTSNNAVGAGRISSGNDDFKTGQAIGDAVSTVTGAVETVIGGGGEVLGVGLDATGVGAVLGVPLNVAAAGLVVHGATTTAVSGVHLAQDASDATSSGQPYKRPTNATTPEQRTAVQDQPCATCGATGQKNNADHIDPLVEQHYRNGSVDQQQMRSPEAVRPQCQSCSNKQGGYLSGFSKAMKKLFFGDAGKQ
jgi:RHS repeat-associated protein